MYKGTVEVPFFNVIDMSYSLIKRAMYSDSKVTVDSDDVSVIAYWFIGAAVVIGVISFVITFVYLK